MLPKIEEKKSTPIKRCPIKLRNNASQLTRNASLPVLSKRHKKLKIEKKEENYWDLVMENNRKKKENFKLELFKCKAKEEVNIKPPVSNPLGFLGCPLQICSYQDSDDEEIDAPTPKETSKKAPQKEGSKERKVLLIKGAKKHSKDINIKKYLFKQKILRNALPNAYIEESESREDDTPIKAEPTYEFVCAPKISLKTKSKLTGVEEHHFYIPTVLQDSLDKKEIELKINYGNKPLNNEY